MNQTMTSNNSITNDYLVTQKVDPSSLSDDRLKKDLALLKQAEISLGIQRTKQMGSLNKTLPKQEIILRYTSLQEQAMDVLKLRNPFKGE